MRLLSDMDSTVESLATQLDQSNDRVNKLSDLQQQFEFACAKFNKKLASVKSKVNENITPDNGLNVMQGHLAELQVCYC